MSISSFLFKGLSHRRRMLACVSALGLSACVPNLGALPTPTDVGHLATARSFDAPAAAWPAERWWTVYGDQQLSELIEEGLAGSPSLAVAAARVRLAQAQMQESGSSRFPTIRGDASIQSARQSANATGLPSALSSGLPSDWNEQGRATLRLDYELDFFGRNRAAFAASTSQAHAAEAEAAQTHLELSTAIALAYADLQRLAVERAAAQDIVRLREASLTLVRQRYDAQLENQGQVAQAQSESAAAHGDLITLEGSIERSRHALAALVGKGPDRGAEIALPASLQAASFGAPQHLSAELIGRRPDLAAARARAEAAARRIDVARADFYPNINLTALIGLHSIGLNTFTDSGSLLGQVGPAISLPIFSGGRIEGAYRGARAEYDEAVALYNSALVDALRDVADVLSDRRTLDARLTAARAALEASEEAYRISRVRYEGGLSSYIDVLTVENGLVARRRALSALASQAFALDVSLIRALGGGFTTSL